MSYSLLLVIVVGVSDLGSRSQQVLGLGGCMMLIGLWELTDLYQILYLAISKTIKNDVNYSMQLIILIHVYRKSIKD